MVKVHFDPKGVDTATLKTVRKALHAELARAEQEGLSTAETTATISVINRELRERTNRRWKRWNSAVRVTHVD